MFRQTLSALSNILRLSQFGLSRSYATLVVGNKASMIKTISDEDVRNFAEISGDNNPLHLDYDFAKTTRYGKPIVHGVLLAGLLSGILGTKYPGMGSVLISYNMEFIAPAYINDPILAEVELIKLEGRRATFSLKCSDSKSKVLAKGEALTLVPKSLVQSKPES